MDNNIDFGQMEEYRLSQHRFNVNQARDSHCSNCVVIKEQFTQQIADLKEHITTQNNTILEILAEQSQLLHKLMCRDLQTAPTESNAPNIIIDKSEFPLENTKELELMNQAMCEDNKSFYVNKMKALMARNAKNPLLAILSQQMVIDYNLDGTHGKKRFKDYINFYTALKDAFYTNETVTDAEDDIRKAIQKVKKQHFLKVCLTRKKMMRNRFK